MKIADNEIADVDELKTRLSGRSLTSRSLMPLSASGVVVLYE